MKEEQTDKKEEVKPKSNRGKWFLGLFLVLILLVVGFTKFTGYFAGQLVKRNVEEYSNNAYTINFERLKLDWSKSQIDLLGFEYRKVDPNATLDNDIEFFASSAQIKLESVIGIYFEKALHIERFLLESPRVKVNQLVSRQKKQNFSFKTGNFYKLIQGFVKSFQMDEFSVNHLSLEYEQSFGSHPQHYIVNDVSFNILNFKLDSASSVTNEDFFFTEEVNLTILNQTIDLGDGKHGIHFDSLYLSTLTNNIEVFNFSLDTLKEGRKGKNEILNTYHLNVPYCGIRGLDFLKAYQSNVLAVDSIVFNDIVINSSLGSVKREKGKIAVDSTVSNGAIKLLLGIFSRYELNQFEINNTQVEVLLANAMDSIKIEGLNFEFSGYVLDSLALTEDMYYPTFEGLQLQVAAPKFGLPNGDRLSANALSFSTYDSSLIISEVDLVSPRTQNVAGNSFHIQAIELYGVNPKEIIQNNEIILSKLNILNPDIKVFKSTNRNKKVKIDLEAFISGKFKKYAIEELNIKQASFQLNDPFTRVRKANIRLSNFQLNESSLRRNRLLLSQRVAVNVSDVSVQIPKSEHLLRMGGLKVDSRSGLFEIVNWQLSPSIEDSANLKFLADAKGRLLSVKGIDYDHIQKLSEIDLSHLKVDGIKAQVNIISQGSKLDTVVKDSTKGLEAFLRKLDFITLNNIGVKDIDVVIQKDGASVAKLSDGYFNAKQLISDSTMLASGKLLLEGDSSAFGLDSLIVPFPKMFHILNVQSIRKDKNARFELSGVSLRRIPWKRLPDTLTDIVIKIPKLTSNYFELLGKENIDTLTIGTLNLIEPIFKFNLPKKKKKVQKPFTLMEALPEDFVDEVFHMLKIEGVNVYDGVFELKKEDTRLNVNRLNLRSKDWMISKSSTWDKNRFTYASDFDLSLQEIELDLPGQRFCHHVDSLRYQFKPNALNVHGIYFNNTTTSTVKKGTELSFYLPYIKVSEPDVFAYITDSNLIVSKIETHNGLLDADLYGGKEKGKKKFELADVVPDYKGFNHVAVHEIVINKMDVQLRTYKDGVAAPLEMDHFSLKVDSFHISPGEVADSNRLLWADNIEMGVKNVYSTVDNGLYEVGADNFSFSTKDKSITLNRFSFVPTVPRLEYALHKGGTQRDVFNIQLKKLNFVDFDFYTLAYTGKISGGNLNLEEPKMEVFKDKRNLPKPVTYKDVLPAVFKKLPVKIAFDSVTVEEMVIKYDEFPKTGREPGTLMLTHTNIKVLNLSNDTADLLKDSTLLISLNSRFLDAGNLTLDLEYNLLAPKNSFVMSSTLGKMNGALINSFIEPAYSAKVISADIDTMSMLVIGNDSIAGGKMGMYYENLKFQFLEAEGQHAKRFMTAVGNAIVSSKNKYHYFKQPRDIFFERNTEKGWINYLVKIELQGVQANAGIKKRQGKEAKKASPEVWEDFEKEYKINLKKQGKKAKARDKFLRKSKRKKQGDA